MMKEIIEICQMATHLKRDNVILFYLMCHRQMSEKYASGNKLYMIAIHFFGWFDKCFIENISSLQKMLPIVLIFHEILYLEGTKCKTLSNI